MKIENIILKIKFSDGSVEKYTGNNAIKKADVLKKVVIPKILQDIVSKYPQAKELVEDYFYYSKAKEKDDLNNWRKARREGVKRLDKNKYEQEKNLFEFLKKEIRQDRWNKEKYEKKEKVKEMVDESLNILKLVDY